jgi:ribosomal protein S18 acetylase RimI-like enzyme
MTPWRFSSTDDPAPILALIQACFAYMEGRIDPPSSMLRLTPEAVRAQAEAGEVWVIGPREAPLACVFFTAKPEALYIGKLAVDPAARGQGYARMLVDLAEARARDLGLPALELQTRVELVENHATFRALGFEKTGETAHPGFDRPTSFRFRKVVE